MPGDHLSPSYLQQEIMRVGPKLRESASQLIQDPRVGNFTTPDHIEVLFLLIDPTGHEVSRDQGQTYVSGFLVTTRAVNYATYRQTGGEITGRTVKDILVQTTAELDELQQRLIMAVNEHRSGHDIYIDQLARFAALYFALDRPPLPALTYIKPFRDNITIEGLVKPLKLGTVQGKVGELAPGMRGIASIKELSGTGTALTLVDLNPYVTRTLSHYVDVVGAFTVEVKLNDARTTDAIDGKGTVIVTGLHHLSDIDIEAVIANVARSLPEKGVFYYRDSEVENPGLATVMETALKRQNLQIIHRDTLPRNKGFEFVTTK